MNEKTLEETAAYQEGYEAFGTDNPVNPYHPKDPLNLQWEDGYHDAKEKAKG